MPDHKIHSSRREAVLLEPSVSGPGVAIYDVCDLLPRLPNKPPSIRPKSNIKMITLHHSDSSNLAKDGFQELINCAAFCIRPEEKTTVIGSDGKPHVAFKGRGFRSIAYHFWIPRYEDIIDGYRAVYRGLRDAEIGSNCQGINAMNVGVVYQGNTTTMPVSVNHQTCLSFLIPHLMAEYKISDASMFFGHCDADKHGGKVKPACPGTTGTQLMVAQRDYLRKSEFMV
jgi:hypothetical protein